MSRLPIQRLIAVFTVPMLSLASQSFAQVATTSSVAVTTPAQWVDTRDHVWTGSSGTRTTADGREVMVYGPVDNDAMDRATGADAPSSQGMAQYRGLLHGDGDSPGDAGARQFGFSGPGEPGPDADTHVFGGYIPHGDTPLRRTFTYGASPVEPIPRTGSLPAPGDETPPRH